VNTATKITELPALTADSLQSNGCLVDNLFPDLWTQIGIKALLKKGWFFPHLDNIFFQYNWYIVKSSLLTFLQAI